MQNKLNALLIAQKEYAFNTVDSLEIRMAKLTALSKQISSLGLKIDKLRRKRYWLN